VADNINDEIVDLTEPEGQEDAEKEKKKVKAPKPPKPPKNDEPKPEKKAKGKKKKGGKLKLILIIVLVVLIAGFIFEELYFNYLGTRDIFIDAIVKLDPDYRTREANLDIKETDLNKFQAELDTRERTITSRESQYERRNADLNSREETIREQEQQSAPLYKRQLTEQELEDMQSLSRSYSLMAPEVAATILGELGNSNDVATILYYMTERNAAAILAVMNPDFAAELTNILLYS